MLAHEAVLRYCELVTSKNMQLGRLARRMKDADFNRRLLNAYSDELDDTKRNVIR